jgi:hypothetical protein
MTAVGIRRPVTSEALIVEVLSNAVISTVIASKFMASTVIG